MQLIFLLIGLFFIACVFYGVYSGVGSIARGVARLSKHRARATGTQQLAAATSLPTEQKSYVEELQALFALRQSGALTPEEFERLKERLLSELTTTTCPPHQETP